MMDDRPDIELGDLVDLERLLIADETDDAERAALVFGHFARGENKRRHFVNLPPIYFVRREAVGDAVRDRERTLHNRRGLAKRFDLAVVT